MGAELRYVIRNTFTPTEFEDGWKAVLVRHGAESNEYPYLRSEPTGR